MTTAALDERKEVHGSEDFEKLGVLLHDLAGQPVLRVTVGAELVFHLGQPQQYRTERLKGLARGSWQLRVMRSPWQIRPLKPEGMTISAGLPFMLGEPLSDEKLESLFEQLFKEAKCEALKVSQTADLSISFSNGYALVLFCKYAPPDPTKALWKVSTPYKMAIHVFGEPAFCWSYLRSDVPQREG
jgi:hypothetical protein